MKTLKTIAIIAIAGTTVLSAQGIKDNRECGEYQQKLVGKHHKAGKHYKHSGQHKNVYKGVNTKNPNKRIFRALRQLDLTDAQKEQLKEIRKSMRSDRKRVREQFRGTTGIRKFISVDGFDKESFTEAANKRAQGMIEVRAGMLQKVIAILTPEQRLELIDILKRKGKRKSQK